MSRSPRSDSSPSGGQSSDDWFDAPVSSPRPSSHAANPPAAPTPAPASPSGRTRPTLRTWIASGLGAAVLGVAAIGGVSYAANHAATTGTAATASADGQGAPGAMGGGPGGGGGGGGTITAIDGSTLTVTLTAMGPQSSSSSGTATTVVTSSDTTFSATTTGSLSDVQAGDHVLVMGTTAEDGTVAATAIVDQGTQAVSDGPGAGGAPPDQASGSSDQQSGMPTGAPPDQQSGSRDQSGQQPGGNGQQSGMPGRPTAGTVTAFDGSTLTLTTTDGSTVQVTTSSSTTVSVVHTSTLADLAVGDSVRVMGSTGSDGTLTATAVREGADAMGPGARTS